MDLVQAIKKRVTPEQWAGGQRLLKEAKEHQKKRKESSERDVAHASKCIAKDIISKGAGRLFFIPDENYSRNYELAFGKKTNKKGVTNAHKQDQQRSNRQLGRKKQNG